MRRIAAAALLLMAGSGVASGNPGPCTFGYGCGGFCFRLFPHMHQHGPLYNYGPYYGYPPFEPYGYWNAYLQYTGPVGPVGGDCGKGCFNKIKQGNPNPLRGNGGRGRDSGECGKSVLDGSILNGGLGQSKKGGCHPCGHHRTKSSPCNTCGTIAAAEIESRPVFERYTGYGDPILAAAYYANTPALTDPDAVMPATLRNR